MGMQDKIILITGGTGALGSALVTEALAQHATVLFTYFAHEEKAQSFIAAGARGIRLDLSSNEGCAACIDALRGIGERVDVLINNAVAVRDKTLVSMSEESWDYVLRVGFFGVRQLTDAVLPFVRKSVRGKIFNIVSRMGIHGAFGQANYSAAKGALLAWTRNLARELGAEQIAVNAINPGFMRSAITECIPADVVQKNIEKSCFGTYSEPSEVARFILYLASDNVTTVSGQLFDFETRIFE